LLSEWQTADARDDRQRINRARQVAEDLFKPRQQTIPVDVPTSAPNAVSTAGQQPRRQPRIFAIPPQMPTGAARVEAPTDQKQIRPRAAVRRETREIPASQYGRVRALTSYGMTGEQVADLYGVTVDEIERIMSRPGHARAAVDAS
jgi:hypothetical protein